MSVEENKALITRYFGFAKTRDLEAAKDCYSPDATVIYNMPVGETPARELFKMLMLPLTQVFPDYQYHIEDIFGEGDKVAVRYTFTGTHQGEFRGIPPTGKVLTTEGIAIYQVVGGMILQSRRYSNTTEMLLQLRGVSTTSQ